MTGMERHKALTDKRFVFVNLSIGVRVMGVNHGIASLAPILRRHAYYVSVLHLTEEIAEDEFLDRIAKERPSLIGFSCTSHQFKYLIKYSRALERHGQILQIAGGVHACLDPMSILSKTAVEGVCIGEGERPLEELLDLVEKGEDFTGAKGFFWKVGNSIRKNPIPPFVQDLSSLELPDYSVFDRNLVVRPWSVDRSLVVQKEDVKKYIEIMVSRGCPYNCHYCCNKALADVYPSPNGYFRLLSVDYCINFLTHILNQYPEVQYIEFLDDLLVADTKWFLEFARRYKEAIGLPYRLCGRFELMSPQIIDALTQSGCVRILFGLESGDETVRKELLNRHHPNGTILKSCQLVKEAGITICTLNIVGLPFETKKQMYATLQLNKKIAPEFGTCYFFHPYKGTYLYQLCERDGLLKDEKETIAITSNYSRPFIKLVDMSDKECIAFHKKICFYFFTQTLKYRCRTFHASHKGIKKLAIVLAMIKMLCKGIKLYYADYVKKTLAH